MLICVRCIDVLPSQGNRKGSLLLYKTIETMLPQCGICIAGYRIRMSMARVQVGCPGLAHWFHLDSCAEPWTRVEIVQTVL